jgi:hypothetical protein
MRTVFCIISLERDIEITILVSRHAMCWKTSTYVLKQSTLKKYECTVYGAALYRYVVNISDEAEH